MLHHVNYFVISVQSDAKGINTTGLMVYSNIPGNSVDFVQSYGLEALKMNMLSGAGASRLGGVGGSSSSDSSSSSSVSFSSNSLLFTAKTV